MKLFNKIFRKDVVINIVERNEGEISELQILAFQMLNLVQSCNKALNDSACRKSYRKTEIAPNKYDWIPEENSFCPVCNANAVKIRGMQDHLHKIIERNNIFTK